MVPSYLYFETDMGEAVTALSTVLSLDYHVSEAYCIRQLWQILIGVIRNMNWVKKHNISITKPPIFDLWKIGKFGRTLEVLVLDMVAFLH